MSEDDFYVPSTVSPQAQEMIRALSKKERRAKAFRAKPHDLETWKRFLEMSILDVRKDPEKHIQQYQPTLQEAQLGGVPVIEICPRNWQDNHKVLVYAHGGAYTLNNARACFGASLPVADQTGLRVVSIDYTTAPHAKWEEITDQVLRVYEALREQGFAPRDIALYGDSAGGSLVAGAVLKMRDQGIELPAALVLWSPWSDITETGETYQTLKDAEPTYLYELVLKPSADAYADPEDQKHPYVSPVYGDFTQGFPPTLIQGGTKEIFLSNFVRLYQAIDQAGQSVKLDLYEGMPHVFQGLYPDLPESETARKKMAAFLQEQLDY